MARLVASGIKQEPIFTGTTPRQLKPGATAVAGSVAQLPCVEAELKAEPCTGASSKGPKPVTTSKVNVLPFTVNLTRLTQKEIDMHTKKSRIVNKLDLKIVVHKLPLQPQQDVILAPPKQPRTPVSPAITHSKICARAPKVPKWKISSKPSELPQPKPTFQVRRHVLKWRKTKAYLKCRVTGCLMAYITFNTV